MELSITLNNPHHRVQLFGPADMHLRFLRDLCEVRITARDGLITFRGHKDAVNKAANLLEQMQKLLHKVDHITHVDMQQLVYQAAVTQDETDEYQIPVYVQDRIILPRTEGQKKYIATLRKQDMVFCTGPAGTGKTYLAVAMAVAMLKRQEIRRIILARPAVEAGEKLGFLPGDLQAKVNPYLRPLFDALGDMMDFAQIKRFMANDIIEVVPLAFMRGRTLNEALVILDEAQNTTAGQMLMFLTRMGQGAKMIITGDDSQIDLPDHQVSGLVDAIKRLRGIKGIGFITLTEKDIVRHKLVQTIVKAYDNHNSRHDEQEEK